MYIIMHMYVCAHGIFIYYLPFYFLLFRKPKGPVQPLLYIYIPSIYIIFICIIIYIIMHIYLCMYVCTCVHMAYLLPAFLLFTFLLFYFLL